MPAVSPQDVPAKWFVNLPRNMWRDYLSSNTVNIITFLLALVVVFRIKDTAFLLNEFHVV